MENSRFKFRAWSISGKMYDRVLAGPGDPCSIVWCDTRKDWVNFDEHSGHLMQFTGLHDKNGKEIFEGDVIHDCLGINGKVYFDIRNGRWRVSGDITPCALSELAIADASWEVIGNIYENPELLSN